MAAEAADASAARVLERLDVRRFIDCYSSALASDLVDLVDLVEPK